jgi:hypothetical protein
MKGTRLGGACVVPVAVDAGHADGLPVLAGAGARGRIAATTHPDRADGGDPERLALVAAAYTELRTQSGCGEARATLVAAAAAGPARSPVAIVAASGATPAAHLLARIRLGRPVRLALRILATVAAGLAGFLAAGPGPAGPALATGALTWLILTIRRDLSPP